MFTKILAISLLGSTALAVALYPQSPNTTIPHVTPAVIQTPAEVKNARPKIEVVFVLDTTGSMSGLIHTAKEKIWSIATTMSQAQPAPEIKMGLVAYRDRGDDYVTKITNLGSDLDSVYATLMDYQAGGGGDGPESVNKALYDAVNTISWSKEPNTYKVIFLVGDAPPHMDYQDEVQYPEIVKMALQSGIVINAIQCGQENATAARWNEIAKLGGGDFLQVEQAGGALAIATPYDSELASLSKKIDDTRLYYGTREEMQIKQGKVEATEKLHASASIESRARRAAFNASSSGDANLFGEDELVNDVINGRVKLDEVDKNELPEPMRVMAPEAKQALIEEKASKREELKRQIQSLTEQRQGYLKNEAEKRKDAKESLDHKLYDTLRKQTLGKGMLYESETPAY
jgi:Mg-chelatase subunit ChlD